MEPEVAEVVADVTPPIEAETHEAAQDAYDRIANPNQEPKTPELQAPTAEEPPAQKNDELESLKSQVARIPELEKRLRDEGGRYGALKQTIEQLQQRMTEASAAKEVESAQGDLDEALKGIKDSFGEDSELYSSLRSAFSKVARGGKAMDPDALKQMVSDGIKAARDAEDNEAIETLTELHPSWMEDRESPDYQEWLQTLPARDRNHFLASKDPYFVAKNLETFHGWKAQKAKSETQPPPKETAAPKVQPSKRLQAAVLPTQGTKPSTPPGDDKSAQARAAYERVAGNRR